MECLICKNKSVPFLTKRTFKIGYKDIVKDIEEFNYYKCTNCGFTISKTHVDMSTEVWLKLNDNFHHFIENNHAPINQPPYLEQAMIINLLNVSGILPFVNALDYAGGYGTLSLILKDYYGLKLPVYDPYINGENVAVDYIQKENLEKYGIVFNSALFEHLYRRELFDEINNLVKEDGCMILHTLVCENIPADSNWFYMEPPVHCAFHTNKSMNILMDQWGYISSIYSPAAKIWILFKKEPEELLKKITELNCVFQKEIFFYKEGFVDYWKGF
ncbi:methyltransferase domain-containing protein [Flavobacterium sp.]|jgi:hypothetical protein|uniref:methyltransferase domain-containing protein n=1 Tax=Flavobacterium sp. TaxID=239 RepID=UPI0037C150BE